MGIQSSQESGHRRARLRVKIPPKIPEEASSPWRFCLFLVCLSEMNWQQNSPGFKPRVQRLAGTGLPVAHACVSSRRSLAAAELLESASPKLSPSLCLGDSHLPYPLWPQTSCSGAKSQGSTCRPPKVWSHCSCCSGCKAPGAGQAEVVLPEPKTGSAQVPQLGKVQAWIKGLRRGTRLDSL